MCKGIYLDNAASSFPKAPGVAEAMVYYINQVGRNVGRGRYRGADEAAALVLETRTRLARLLGAEDARNVVFSSGATLSLNMLVKGLLHKGDHVLTSSMEHNALMRPLGQMAGVSFTRIPSRDDGTMDVECIPALIQPNTRAIFVTHASNVNGVVFPLPHLGKIARAHGLLFVVDAAQTAGIFDIDMKAMHLDAVAFAGHKGLLGPQGIGGMALSPRLAQVLEPLVAGGTGSLSEEEFMPSFLPDKLEAGTQNLPGIYGLHAALGYLEEKGIASIRTQEQALARHLAEGLAELPGLRLPGPKGWENRAPVISVDFVGRDNGEVAAYLSQEHGIAARCGLQCAPIAHKTLGTFPQGMVRFSPGHLTREAEIEATIQAVAEAVSPQH